MYKVILKDFHMVLLFDCVIPSPDLIITAAIGTLTPFSLIQSAILSDRLHLCVVWKSAFTSPFSSSRYLYQRYSLRSALHVSEACNASIQWSTCAQATAGLLDLSSVDTRRSVYQSRKENCRTRQ